MERFDTCLRNTLYRIIEDTALHAAEYSSNPGHDFTRNRKLPLPQLIRTLIAMEGNSIDKELYDLFNHNADERFITKSAFVQQRGKLKHEALRAVLHGFNKHTGINDTNRYDGYKLYAIDGTDVNIACNEDSDTYFPEKSNSVTGKGYNQFHVNALFDITNSTFSDAIIQPSPKENEIDAARQLIRDLEDNAPRIFIMDRAYCSLDLIAAIRENSLSDYIIRARSNFVKEVRTLPDAECDFDASFIITTRQTNENKEAIRNGSVRWLPGKSLKGKDNKVVTWHHGDGYLMEFRIVRFLLDTGEWETLVTSLDRKHFPIRKLKELYHLRWGIETSFRELKYAIGLTNFHAKKEESVKQEIYARLIAYNFCSRITNSVAVEPKAECRWGYQVNFTMAIHICLHYLKSNADIDVRAHIERYLEPVRPGRSDERNIKPKSFIQFNYRVA